MLKKSTKDIRKYGIERKRDFDFLFLLFSMWDREQKPFLFPFLIFEKKFRLSHWVVLRELKYLSERKYFSYQLLQTGGRMKEANLILFTLSRKTIDIMQSLLKENEIYYKNKEKIWLELTDYGLDE